MMRDLQTLRAAPAGGVFKADGEVENEAPHGDLAKVHRQVVDRPGYRKCPAWKQRSCSARGGRQGTEWHDVWTLQVEARCLKDRSTFAWQAQPPDLHAADTAAVAARQAGRIVSQPCKDLEST